MASEYWDRFWRNRSSRRRFLGTGAALGAGTAGFALVGCGNDDDDDDVTPPPPDDDDDVTPPPDDDDDTVAEGNYGGTLRYPYVGAASANPPTLFPYENLTYLAQIQSSMHYSRLLTEYGGPGIHPDDWTTLEGDLAESMPEQPDETTYIFKFRQNIHWHDKEPVNGAQATAEDFAETYQAFLALSQNAATYQDVIASMEATDEYTLQVTTTRPFAPFLTVHASTPEGIWFIPVRAIEGGQVYDAQVGTGPWVFDRFESGVSLTWDRFDNYFRDEGWPYFDRVEASLIGEPTRMITSLRAGELDMAPNMGGLYSELAELDGEIYSSGHGNVTSIWFNFDNDGGRWRDKRLRQALSMSINRESILNALDASGEGDWQSPFCSPNLPPWFLSPRDGDYGDNARYFEYNPEEARALIEAATGETNPRIRINANIDAYGRLREQKWELTAASLEEVGWDVELNYEDYGSYITSTFLGDIAEGVAYGPIIGSPRDPHDVLSRNHASTSARRNWSGTPIDEQEQHDARIREQEGIMDLEERLEYIHQFQRDAAEYLLFVPSVGPAGLSYHNPYVQNYHPKAGYNFAFTAFSKAWFTEERIAQD